MRSLGDENIRHLADGARSHTVDDHGVDVRIVFDSTDPPTGHIQRSDNGADGEAFSGWMDLLRALEGLLGRDAAPSGSRS